MKKFLRILAVVIGLIVLAVGGLIAYIQLALPKNLPVAQVQAPKDAVAIERGRYLANGVMVCMDCHSERDWTKYSGPVKPGTLGKGGEIFSAKYGFPGDFSAKNLTPTHLGDWSDGEILRALVNGVNKKGEPLFPVMPWHAYAQADTADMLAVIAYLRTLAPIENPDIPESKPAFPFSLILRTLPKEATLKPKPMETDTLAYGQYLTTIAACADCHTQQVKGKPVEGMALAGGFKFPMASGGKAVSSNITPDPETGIGNWTADQFVARFKHYADSNSTHAVAQGQKNTPMPWSMYATMTESDLRAIFAYLRTVTPVKNSVTPFVNE
jgi:mono/diheme cytochrome c family protein